MCHFIRSLVVLLIVSTLGPISALSANGATSTKTIVVKSSTGSLYQGAFVQAYWYAEDKEEQYSNILTTNASGAVEVSYDSDATYGYIVIQPAAGDTTHAIGRIMNFFSFSTTSLEFTFKRSDVKVLIRNSDNSDAPAGSFFGLIKLHLPILRTGVFGINGDDVISLVTGNIASAVPKSSVTDQFVINRYYTRTKSDTGWNFRFFEDKALTQEVSPIDGVHVFTFRSNNVQITLKDSFGQAISIPDTELVYIGGDRIRPSNAVEGEWFYDYVEGKVSSGGVWKSNFKAEGEYRLNINPQSGHLVPSTSGPTIWVNGAGQVSSTSSSAGFQDTLTLDFNLPVATFKLSYRDSNNDNSLLGFNAYVYKKTGSNYESGDDYRNYFYSSNGKGSIYLPIGDYKIVIASNGVSRPDTTIYANVTNSGAVITNSTGSTLIPVDGILELSSTAASIKLRLIDNGKAISYGYFEAHRRTNEQDKGIGADYSGYIFTNMQDGTWDVYIRPNGNEVPARALARYVMVVTSGAITSLKRYDSQTEITQVDGFYPLGLAEPNIKFQIKVQGSSPASGSRYWGNWFKLDEQGIPQASGSLAFNSSFEAGALVEPGNYQFSINNSRQGELFSRSKICTVASGNVTQCSTDFPAANLIFKVNDQNGNLLTSEYNANLKTIVGNIDIDTGHGYPSWENGKISARLFDGEYKLELNPQQINSSVGAKKTYRVSISGGAVTRVFDIAANSEVAAVSGEYQLSLQKTNFIAQLKVNGNPITNAWINVVSFKQSCCEYVWSSTNNQGKFELYLSEGEHEITVTPPSNLATTYVKTIYKVKVKNSTVELLESSDGTVISATAGVYQITLSAPNVSGQLQITNFANPKGYQGRIRALRLSADGQYYQDISSAEVDENGNYVLKLETGSYRLVYYNYLLGRDIVSPTCMVASSGATTCNVTFPDSNLTFKVVNANGESVNGQVGVQIRHLYDSGTNILYSGLANPQASNDFMANLLDGNYLLVIFPNGDLSSLYSESQFSITVSGGVVTALKNYQNQSISAADGLFVLPMRTPTISGTVVTDDGTTPYPEANIQVLNEKSGYGISSNAQGRFGILLTDDGNYQIVATPRYSDTQFFGSESQIVEVVSGQGSNSVVLRLRKPNVSGTVRGPTGLLSAFNWINVKKRNDYGGFDYIPNMQGRSTNASGVFSYFLSPGTYRFEASADTSAKGSRTASADCVVSAGQNSICDITLSAANVKIRAVDSSGNALNGTSGYFNLAEYKPSISRDWDWVNFDLDGSTSTFLEDATWQLRLYPPQNNSSISQTSLTFTIANGQVTSVLNSSGAAVIASAEGVYTLVLPGVNLSGEITFNNSRINHWAHVIVKRKDGDYFNEIASQGTGSGQFGFKVEPGTYKIEVKPYFGDNSTRATTRSATCVVASSGTTTCNVALQAPNFLGKITTSSGATFNDASVYLYTETAKGDIWEYWIDNNQGKINAYLENGVYRLNVQPYWQFRSLYTEQNYQVTVANGQITSVVNKLTGGTVSAVDGRYPLVLGTPAVRGTVLMPGTSTEKVPNVQIVPIDSQGRERWEYSTQSDSEGKFGLTLPNGDWNVYARIWSGGKAIADSAKLAVKIESGALVPAGEIAIRLRVPNLYGVVIKPGTTEPLSEVSVNIYMNGEYHYSWTNEKGEFGAYIEGSVPQNCGGNCSIYLSTWKSTLYTSKRYEFTALGDLLNKEMGAVNAMVTVLTPSGANTLPNKWGYVAVEEFDGTNYIWQPGMHTNELGKVGLSLTSTKTYRITAYPNWEKEGSFSPKSTIITNFDASTHAQTTITFDTPNLTFAIKDRLGNLNSWGWYEITKLNTIPDPDVYEFYRYGRLDQQGKGAQSLPNGAYEIRFYPSDKAIGIVKTQAIEVVNNLVVGSANLEITLPSGNVSGNVKKSGVAVAGATVAAVAADDPTKIVSTVTLMDGSYEISLDMSRAWVLKALDPISTASGSLNLLAVSGGSTSTELTGKDIALT